MSDLVAPPSDEQSSHQVIFRSLEADTALRRTKQTKMVIHGESRSVNVNSSLMRAGILQTDRCRKPSTESEPCHMCHVYPTSLARCRRRRHLYYNVHRSVTEHERREKPRPRIDVDKPSVSIEIYPAPQTRE